MIVPIEVTGTSFRQPALVDLSLHLEKLTGCKAALRPEPTNQYDPRATAVDVCGVHVAYLRRDWREKATDEAKAAIERLLEGTGELKADIVAYLDDAGERRWTVRAYGVFGDAAAVGPRRVHGDADEEFYDV